MGRGGGYEGEGCGCGIMWHLSERMDGIILYHGRSKCTLSMKLRFLDSTWPNPGR